MTALNPEGMEDTEEDFSSEPLYDACFVDPRSPGDLYLFKGSQVLLVDSGGNKRRWDKPQKIAEWRSLYPFSDGIDACFVDPRSPGDLYLFKGNQVCLVDSGGNKRRWENPQKIAEWRPKYPFQDKIEACFVSQRSPGDLYLFKGSEVAEVDSGGDKLRWGPTSIAEWRPAYPFDSNINACFVDLRSPGDLYMFRGKYVCLVDADGDGVRKGRQTVASWRSQYLF